MTPAHPPLTVEELSELHRDPRASAEQLGRLLATMASEDEEERAWANDCLEQIDAPTVTQLGMLETLSSDTCAPVAGWACKLLGKSGSSQCESALVNALSNHANMTVRQNAALGLGRLESLTEAAKEALHKATCVEDARLKRLAQQALEQTH
jgi:hypothetical protein